ncbi:MAG TPA: transcriptional regulator [Treponema sp.]|nr:transcriptional regulator [Treponema sp.]
MAETTDNRYNYRSYDSLMNSPIRLAAMSLLAGTEEAEFTFIREKTGTTDGNLSRHLSKLEDEGLIAVEKRFVGKKPVTVQRITENGRQALKDYVANLESLIGTLKETT